MSKDNTKKISVFSILIFILCGLIAIYTVASFVSVTTYIREMFEYGQITFAQNFFDILSYYVTNCVNYIIYICILLAIWWVSDKKMVNRTAKAASKTIAEPTGSESPTKTDAAKSAEDNKFDSDKAEPAKAETAKEDAKAAKPEIGKSEIKAEKKDGEEDK